MKLNVVDIVKLIVLCIISLIAFGETEDIVNLNAETIQVSDDLWQRIRSGFILSSHDKLVRFYQQRYSQHPIALSRMLNNAKPYLYYMLTEIERMGLPTELAMLPGIESWFNPHAQSWAQAAGMWQFVPVTAKRFKLLADNEIDDRFNIVKSTRVALWYLKYLFLLFKQWDVAIMAYNCGEGAMYRSIQHSGQQIGFVKVERLDLPSETKNYLPKLIALSNIIAKPSKFGITLQREANTPYFMITKPLFDTTIEQFIDLAEIDLKQFILLNPQFKQTHNYSLDSTTKILLPIKNQDIYYLNASQYLARQADKFNKNIQELVSDILDMNDKQQLD